MGKQTVLASEPRSLVRNVRPDARGRISLGRALDGLDKDVTFTIHRDCEGRIILDPQVSIPASEAWLLRNPKALAMVRRGLVEAAEGGATDYDSVSELFHDIES